MNLLEKYPGVKEAMDNCEETIQKILGKKVSVTFKLKLKHLSTNALAMIICDVCEVSWKQVISDSRKSNIIVARHLFCYYAFYIQKKTLWDIAHILNRTDHSTIIHARDKVVKMKEVQDELYMPSIIEIEERINEQLQ